MAGARKFVFDTEFAPDGAILSDTPKKLTPEEIAAECAAAYERGKLDALVAAEQRTAAAIETLAGAASTVLTHLGAESRALREQAARVALAAARKIAGAALDAHGPARINAAIEAAMDSLRHQPRLLVKVAPETIDAVKPHIEDMCAEHAYVGAVLLRAQAGLRKGEVVIDWSDGVVSSSPQETEARISALVEAALAAPETH